MINSTMALFPLFRIFALVGILLSCPALYGAENQAQDYPSLNNQQIDWIGDQIYNNECNRLLTCLTSWNEGESFPSMGIGHFIWFQAGQEEIFEESFPALLRYFQEHGLTLPNWLVEQNLESPWPNRRAFQADIESSRMIELRTFLNQHTREQTAFIIHRFENALHTILESETDTHASRDTEELPVQQIHEKIKQNFYKVANSELPYGLYALIDYVNFKGSGTAPNERYQGQGWGLKQVLLGMDSQQAPLPAFIQSARDMLALRVQNAPAERNESRWLRGWNNRLNTYNPSINNKIPL